MAERPFHHGNLRTVLLDQAESALRERGVDELSLRELAREVGVSHGAPRSHFIDRKALLDALAERGFLRLAGAMRDAASAQSDYAEGLRAAAHAYVRFAVDDAALLELMFAAKMQDPSESLENAAIQLFTTIDGLVRDGVSAGVFDANTIDRMSLLVSATMQGVGTFVGTRRVNTADGDRLIDDAIRLFLSGSLG